VHHQYDKSSREFLTFLCTQIDEKRKDYKVLKKGKHVMPCKGTENASSIDVLLMKRCVKWLCKNLKVWKNWYISLTVNWMKEAKFSAG
jgi:hypothetical protein